MYKKELKLIVWLIAGSLFCYSDSTLPADDLYLRSEKVESTGRGNEARSRDQKVPEFMVKMYKSVETGNNQLPVGNTVRSMAGKFSMFITFRPMWYRIEVVYVSVVEPTFIIQCTNCSMERAKTDS